MADTLNGIVWILYIVLGYWSVGQTVYANKIIIGPMGTLWIKRFILGFMFGWILIPVAIIKNTTENITKNTINTMKTARSGRVMR